MLAVLDPLRVAEDYATIDQLSRGRVELVIGKGNELRQLPMFGVAAGDQRDQLAEKHELLSRLRREEDVSWTGKFGSPLESVTSLRANYKVLVDHYRAEYARHRLRPRCGPIRNPYGGRPAFTDRTVPDAAAAITQARVSPGPLG